jgi:hypothetical protein
VAPNRIRALDQGYAQTRLHNKLFWRFCSSPFWSTAILVQGRSLKVRSCWIEAKLNFLHDGTVHDGRGVRRTAPRSQSPVRLRSLHLASFNRAAATGIAAAPGSPQPKRGRGRCKRVPAAAASTPCARAFAPARVTAPPPRPTRQKSQPASGSQPGGAPSAGTGPSGFCPSVHKHRRKDRGGQWAVGSGQWQWASQLLLAAAATWWYGFR